MQAGQLFPLSTTDGVQFTEALIQNAVEQEDLALPGAVGGGGVGRCRIRSAVFWSSQNLDWEFQVYGSVQTVSGDPNLDTYRGRWSWVAADAVRNGGAGLYKYYIDGLDICYEDEDYEGSGLPPLPAGVAKIHLLLVNRSAAAKLVYPAGNARLRLMIEPTHGG